MVSIADVLMCRSRYALILGDSLHPVTGLASLGSTATGRMGSTAGQARTS